MKLGTAAVDFNRPCQTGCRARAGSRKAHCTSQPVARPPAAGHAGPSEKGFRQKDLKGTSRALGTCGIRLWLLPSGPDQVPGPQCEEARPLAIVYQGAATASSGMPARVRPGIHRLPPLHGPRASKTGAPARHHVVSTYVSFPRRCMQPSGRRMALIPCHPPRSDGKRPGYGLWHGTGQRRSRPRPRHLAASRLACPAPPGGQPCYF